MNQTLDKTANPNNRPVPKSYKRRKRNNNSGGFFRSFLMTLTVLAFCTAIIYGSDLKRGITNVASAITAGPESRTELSLPFSSKRQNILLLGVDATEEGKDPFAGNRSDTMLLVSIAPYGKDVNVLSIPRDSKVYISDQDKPDKINHAFVFGGSNLAVSTVEDTFGVNIDHYVALSNQALVKFIDMIGGLPIYVEKDMVYEDKTAGLKIDLKKGQQTLSGKEAEGYLRFRKDSLGDIGRITRQQWFFNALLSRLKDPMVLIKIPDVIKILPSYIKTDLSIYELSQYAAMVKGVDSSSLRVATLPGSPSTKGATSYWILDPDKTQEMIDRLVYRDKVAPLTEALSVGILYTEDKEALANDLRVQLEQAGALVKMQTRDKLTHDHIAIHNLNVDSDIINSYKSNIPFIKEKQTVYDPVGFNKAAKDFTIILAGS